MMITKRFHRSTGYKLLRCCGYMARPQNCATTHYLKPLFTSRKIKPLSAHGHRPGSKAQLSLRLAPILAAQEERQGVQPGVAQALLPAGYARHHLFPIFSSFLQFPESFFLKSLHIRLPSHAWGWEDIANILTSVSVHVEKRLTRRRSFSQANTTITLQNPAQPQPQPQFALLLILLFRFAYADISWLPLDRLPASSGPDRAPPIQPTFSVS